MTNSHNSDIKYDHKLLNGCLKAKAVEYLTDKLLKSMKDDIESIATQAVAQWSSIKFSQDPQDFGAMNINIDRMIHLLKLIQNTHKKLVNNKLTNIH